MAEFLILFSMWLLEYLNRLCLAKYLLDLKKRFLIIFIKMYIVIHQTSCKVKFISEIASISSKIDKLFISIITSN